ncbi:hypothetical protein CMV_013174, partial [Castanea mollissima]
IKTNPRL